MLSSSQNILFGSQFEEDRYAAVIEACALKPDLAMFDAGDETGEWELEQRALRS